MSALEELLEQRVTLEPLMASNLAEDGSEGAYLQGIVIGNSDAMSRRTLCLQPNMAPRLPDRGVTEARQSLYQFRRAKITR